jgi:hypothetical protein
MDTNSFGIQRLTVTTNLSHFNNLKHVYLKKINHVKAHQMHASAIREVLSTLTRANEKPKVSEMGGERCGEVLKHTEKKNRIN